MKKAAKNKNKHAIVILGVVLVAVLALALVAKMDVVAKWKTKAEGQGWGLSIQGKTELIGKNGEVISLRVIAKMMSLPLSFFASQTEVTAMRVTLWWTASGKDVDWNTLQVTVIASGTGGYSKSVSSSLTEGSTVFILPITTTQLGRTPNGGEEVVWTMDIDVSGQVNDIVGRTLTAQAPTVHSEVSTTWAEPSFTMSSTGSTSTDSGTSTGGCGLPGEHVIWVYNVEAVSTWVEYLPWFGYTYIGLSIVESVLITQTLHKRTKKQSLSQNPQS